MNCLGEFMTIREMTDRFKVPRSTIRDRILRTTVMESVRWDSVDTKEGRKWRLTREFMQDILHVTVEEAVKAPEPAQPANPVSDALSLNIQVTVTREQARRFINWVRSVAGLPPAEEVVQ